MNKKIVVLLTLLALAGLAAASTLTVKQRNDTASLFAERYTVGERFLVEGTVLAPVAATRAAAGVLGSPIEIANVSALPQANTALIQDHWTYTATIKEADAASAASGLYVVELQLDGVARSSIYIAQDTAQSTVVEGVRVSFGLGQYVESSSLYYLVVKPYVPLGETISYTIESFTDTDSVVRWRGVAGVTGTNAALALELGDTLRLTARNPQGDTHNIGFRQVGASASTAITPPGWSDNIAANGEKTISWAPDAAGEYRYACLYHSAMVGTVVVS